MSENENTMPPVIFTDAALAHIRNMMRQKKNAYGFRLSVKQTGCSGYTFKPTIISKNEIFSEDVHFFKEELPIYLDQKYLHMMNGLQIDYIQTIEAGISCKKLVYLNPNEKGRCGCGESFTV